VLGESTTGDRGLSIVIDSRYRPEGASTRLPRPDGLTAQRECESDAARGGSGLDTPRTITS
jgi:hypothetical protein